MDSNINEDHGNEEGNWLVSYADMMTLLVGFFVILLSFSVIDQETFEAIKKATSQQFGGSYQIPFGDIADRIREAAKKTGFGDKVVLKSTDLGVEISFQGALFFDLGVAELKPESLAVLDKMIPILLEESKQFNFQIEGHTDDIPTSNYQFGSNWELSSIRACKVLAVFERKGFSKEKLTAIGYGESRPVVPNRDPNHYPLPENQSQNRRVVIKLIKRAEPS